MSETQHVATAEELAKLNAAEWGKVASKAPSIEEIKSHVDSRSFGEKLNDVIVSAWNTADAGIEEFPELWKQDKGRALALAGEGLAESFACAATFVADVGVSLVYNPLADSYNYTVGNALNAATGLMGVNNNWATLPTKHEFFAITDAAKEAIEFTDPIEEYIVGEDGVRVKNPTYHAELLMKGVGAGSGDVISFVIPSAAIGAVVKTGSMAVIGSINVVRGFEEATQASKIAMEARGISVFSYVKNVERVKDSIEIVETAERIAGKAAKVGKAGKEVKEAAKLEAKAEKLFSKADKILEGKGTRSVLESRVDAIGKKLGGEASSTITRAELADYVSVKVSTRSPKGLKSATSKAFETPAQKIRKIDEKLAKLGGDASKSSRAEKLLAKKDNALEALQKELDEGVNKIAERMGVKGFAADEALNLANMEIDTNLAAGMWENNLIGAYHGLRVADPTANPLMEIPGFAFGTWMNYRAEKSEIEKKEEKAAELLRQRADNTQSKSIDNVNRRIQEGNFEIDLNDLGNFKSKQTPKSTILNGKKIDGQTPEFNKKAAGDETGENTSVNRPEPKGNEDFMKFCILT